MDEYFNLLKQDVLYWLIGFLVVVIFYVPYKMFQRSKVEEKLKLVDKKVCRLPGNEPLKNALKGSAILFIFLLIFPLPALLLDHHSFWTNIAVPILFGITGFVPYINFLYKYQEGPIEK